MNNNKPLVIVLVATVVLVVGAAVVFALNKDSGPSGQYTELATCIADSSATFYGAFWCPHCQDQKEAFGDAVKELPYVECSTPDGKGQMEACIAAGITSYPTWVFADGSQLTGSIALNTLAELTGCSMPTE